MQFCKSPVIIICLFSSVWSTAPALSSLGAGRPEWLSVHAASPELHLFGASLQRQRWPLTGTGPGHLHRCTQAAALPSNTLIIWAPPLMKPWSNIILLPALHCTLLCVLLLIPFCNTYAVTVLQKHQRSLSNFVQHISCLFFADISGNSFLPKFCCPLHYYGHIKLVWALLHSCIFSCMIHLSNSSNIFTCCFIIYSVSCHLPCVTAEFLLIVSQILNLNFLEWVIPHVMLTTCHMTVVEQLKCECKRLARSQNISGQGVFVPK